jgi:hypothetical protein
VHVGHLHAAHFSVNLITVPYPPVVQFTLVVSPAIRNGAFCPVAMTVGVPPQPVTAHFTIVLPVSQ